MKITKSMVEKFNVSGIKHQDPISVFFEDFGPGQGQVTIKQFSDVWASFWGGCGDDGIKAFFLSCDADYLTNKLVKHDRMHEPDIEATKKKLKRVVLGCWLDGSLSKETVKEFWQDKVKHSYDGLNEVNEIRGIEEWANDNFEIEDVYVYEEWYCHIVNKLTPEADNMKHRIIPTIQDALRQEIADEKSNEQG